MLEQITTEKHLLCTYTAQIEEQTESTMIFKDH